MITKGGLIHTTESNLCYALGKDMLHIRIKALKGEVKKAWCRIGDQYIWKSGGAGGGNLEANGSSGWIYEEVEMHLAAITEYHDIFEARISRPTKRSRYAFILESDEETLLFGERKVITLSERNRNEIDIGNYFCVPYISCSDVFTVPDWIRNTVWYQILPDRFFNGDKSNDPQNTLPWGNEPTWYDYIGGDIKGIIEKLDYLKDLGIGGIHFCPLFKGDKSHKYETTDYFSIDPVFGTNELFEQLIEQAHSMGIKVMLDGVFNHVGIHHPFFQDVIQKGDKSEYFDWFCIKSLPVTSGQYETFATNSNMPKLNFNNEKVIQYFLEVGTYWAERYHIDGWRLDVANEIGHDFWRRFRHAVKSVNPNIFIMGEVWHNALPWLKGDQYDSVMNYPLTNACVHFFATGETTAKEFQWKINELLTDYPLQAVEAGYNFLSSHDISRFVSIAGENIDLLLLAYVFLFTLPGSPSVYYGDEIGMEGLKTNSGDSHRRGMVWDEKKWDLRVYENVKKLIHLRNQHSAFRQFEINWLESGNDDVLLYRKDDLLVVLNRGTQDYSCELNHSGYHDFITEKDIVKSIVNVPARGFRLLCWHSNEADS